MKIYVIVGSTGEYSDKNEWPVCFRFTLDEANQVIVELQRQADEFKRWADEPENNAYSKEGEAKRAAMLDPSFSCDYTGTTYHVWTVCEDPREDEQAKVGATPP